VDFKVVAALRSASDEAKKLKEVLTKLEPEVRKLELLGSRVDQRQRETLSELSSKLAETRERYEALTETRKKLAVQTQAHRDAAIVINKRLNPGTMLRVVDSFIEARNALLGPLVATLDPINRAVVLNSKSTTVN
jgi:DNA repair exonuclease SbcCD ATPase subunit